MSIVLYYGLTFFVGSREETASNDMLSLVLLVAGILTVLISFPIKSRLITYAAEQQRVQLVQQAYIVALALSEVPALLGLLDFFATGHRHYYVLFLIAAVRTVAPLSTARTCRKRFVENADRLRRQLGSCGRTFSLFPIKNATG